MRDEGAFRSKPPLNAPSIAAILRALHVRAPQHAGDALVADRQNVATRLWPTRNRVEDRFATKWVAFRCPSISMPTRPEPRVFDPIDWAQLWAAIRFKRRVSPIVAAYSVNGTSVAPRRGGQDRIRSRSLPILQERHGLSAAASLRWQTRCCRRRRTGLVRVTVRRFESEGGTPRLATLNPLTAGP